eukprot:364864-Chlamydomonas_euryale.AAC.1
MPQHRATTRFYNTLLQQHHATTLYYNTILQHRACCHAAPQDRPGSGREPLVTPSLLLRVMAQVGGFVGCTGKCAWAQVGAFFWGARGGVSGRRSECFFARHGEACLGAGGSVFWVHGEVCLGSTPAHLDRRSLRVTARQTLARGPGADWPVWEAC